jgi:pimeloyl-ACP methyl ester carboxylesterase
VPVSHANGISIHYEIAGSGPALVMLHALPFDHNLWLYQVARFSSRFTTIAVDLRGWGRSAKPSSPFSLHDMGADVLGVLSDLDISEPAVLLGCSIGSKIALLLACDHPARFSAAILVGGNSGPQNFAGRIASYRETSVAGSFREFHLSHLRHGVTPAWADSPIGRYLLRGFVERGEALEVESIVQVFCALENADLTPRLPECRVPTLVVNGEHDGARPGGERTASLLKEAEHRILPGTGHCCFLEDPGAFDELVNGFLARHGY